MRTKKIATLAASAFAALAVALPASAMAGPVLDLDSSHKPTIDPVPGGSYAKYEYKISNSGDAETSGPISFDFSIPAAGVEIVSVTDESAKLLEEFGLPPLWGCSIAGDSLSLSCDGVDAGGALGGPFGIAPGEEACFAIAGPCHIIVTLRADPNATATTVHPTATVCGGGATTCPTAAASAPEEPFDVVPAGFKIKSVDGGVLKQNGDPETQAGAHPHTAFVEFFTNTLLDPKGAEYSAEDFQDVITELPPGVVGNPQALPRCTQQQLVTSNCPAASQVGTVKIWFANFADPSKVPLYNVQPSFGTPALLSFNYLNTLVQVYVKLRSGDDYGVRVIAKNAPQTLPVKGVTFTVWGVPGDPSHTDERQCPGAAINYGCAGETPPKPFFTLPTSCTGPVETFLELTTWQGHSDSGSFISHDNGIPPNPIGAEGCSAVDFSPTLEARPTTNVADAPSGLDFDLHVPQHEKCEEGPPLSCENAEAHLRDTTITLPEGLVINPAGANGLGGCSLAQFGYTNTEAGVIHTTPEAASCPDNSKLGTVQVDSPLVDHPLKGAVYIANPYQNPFNSLLALYITLDDPQTGTVVKLAGKVSADPNTGRLTTTVTENPQLPFEDFKLHFFGGAGGALRTPAVCGTYTTTSVLTPWSAPESGPPATPGDPWAITQAPGGGTCPTAQGARPNTPDLDAGALSPIAAASTPTVVNLRRPDGSQEFSTVNLTLPPGMTGKLAGIQACPEAALAAASSHSGQAERSSPSCPAASRIGTVDVAAGAGPAPYHAQGIAYLTGPYKAAPLGMAIITPATAGPFDLGTVVVRVALHVNSETAQITAISDPIPHILAGIPLDVRSAQVKLDRPNFTLNGTSCDPLAFSGNLVSTLGQSAPLAERFQLGECGRLGFKHKLALRLIGGTKRGAHPVFRATLSMPAAGANIASASVALPHSEFLDQAHIGTVCTRVQFAADQCPAASVYGHAVGTSPLLDYAVQGPVYLRSSSNKLPDLVMALHGPPSQPIEVDAVGRVDSIKGGIRSSFEAVPDVPLTQVVLSMEGGKKGLLQNSTNVCNGKNLATAEFEAQNGKVYDFKPPLRAQCKKPRKANKRHHRAARHAVR